MAHRYNEVANVLEQLRDDVSGIQSDMAHVKATIEHVTEGLKGLIHAVRDGNGRPSLMERVKDLENEVAKVTKWCHEHGVSQRSRRRLWAAIIGTLITAISSVLVAILSK